MFSGGALFLLMLFVGVCTYSYAAHSFLVVVEQTAGGIDRVEWPDSPWYERIWKPLYLGLVVVLWVVAAWVVYQSLHATTRIVPITESFLWLTYGALWLLFPITLLSALRGGSRLWLLHPMLAVDFARHFLSVMSFFLLSGLLLFGYALAWRFVLLPYLFGGAAGPRPRRGLLVYVEALFWPRNWVIPIAALAWAAVVLIYGRLLGRLAGEIKRTTKKRKKRSQTAGLREVFVFPWYRTTLRAWLLLSAGCCIVLLVNRVLSIVFTRWS